MNEKRDGMTLEITYKSFSRTEPCIFTVHPYRLKLFKQRWYLLARSEDYDHRFHLVPTFDFRQEILSHGPDYEVISSEWFRDEIKDGVARMYKNYGL